MLGSKTKDICVCSKVKDQPIIFLLMNRSVHDAANHKVLVPVNLVSAIWITAGPAQCSHSCHLHMHTVLTTHCVRSIHLFMHLNTLTARMRDRDCDYHGEGNM